MKAAILGTQHPDVHETEHAILSRAGTQGFRRMASYVPAQMPLDKPKLPPVDEFYQTNAHKFMNALCGQTIKDCNPRVPYLVGIWLLIGSDNPHRLQLYADDKILWQVARLLMRFVIGNTPYTTFQNLPILRWKKPNNTDWLTAQLYDFVHPLVAAIREIHDESSVAQTQWLLSSIKPKMIMSDDMKSDVVMRLKHWKDFSDDELLPIIRPFMLQILSTEQNAT